MVSKSPIFTPLKTKRAFEEISEQIRELIYAGVFKPGDKLPSERELASQFKTGRMALREALRTLEHSGLIYIKQGSFGGTFIKASGPTAITRSISDMIKIGDVTLRELTEARLGIEKVILEYAIARITNEDLELLKENIEETEQLDLKGIKAREKNVDFHLILAKASRNYLFEIIIESIMNVVSSFLQPFEPKKEYTRKVLNYHKEIYQAVKDNDVVAARQKFEKHLLEVNKYIEIILGKAYKKSNT